MANSVDTARQSVIIITIILYYDIDKYMPVRTENWVGLNE